MRLHVLSDLHLEFAPFDLPRTDADVVVLAGDIGVGHMGLRMVAEQVPPHVPVLYVPGNHEYYRAPFHAARDHLRAACAGTRVHFMDRDEVTLAGVRFLGCTLWTDYRALGDETRDDRMAEASVLLNDHGLIRAPDGGPFMPSMMLAEHEASRAWLEERLAAPFDGPTVVITHHAPIRAGFPRWAMKHPALVASSVSDLHGLMGAHRAAAWIFGHTHWKLDVKVRGTRVLSNPRGYPKRPVPGFEPGFTLDV